MGLGTSLFLIAVGAILRWAVTLSVAGVRLEVVGLVLMIVGGLGLVISLIHMTAAARRRRAVVYSDPRYLH
jgi:hypothetical protein